MRWEAPGGPDRPPAEEPGASPREALDGLGPEWPLHPGGLDPPGQWRWYAQLWSEVCTMRTRFRLPVRSGWWQDSVQVEALAALAAWVARYDSGAWDDPPGKLALLFDLDRIGALLRDGGDPFVPERDHSAFVRHLRELGLGPPA